MNKIKNILITLLLTGFLSSAYAVEGPWMNNLRGLFTNNAAFIYALNIRTFGAKDYNKNDIIELELGEAKGTFINAIPKLKNLKDIGINTIYLLPITKTGKLKALGTAGSLYAMDSFDTINPQFLDETYYTKDIKVQAKKFVNEAHKLGMHVIVDLPSCGSYDMSLEHPELFIKDSSGNAVSPLDWSDVRLFKVYENNSKTLNQALIKGYKSFVDLVQEIGVDGIRADVAAIKPKEFWSEIINYARTRDSQFLFLAEASLKWSNPAKGYLPYTSVEDLLSAGFDGYYSDWSNLYEIKDKDVLWNKISEDASIIKKFDNQKAVITNMAGHDQKSPGTVSFPYWRLVNWLNVTLPVNPYVLDGFPAGDKYIYRYQNQKAEKTYTDNDTYFVHPGQLDIFNFSRAPYSVTDESFIPEYSDAVQFRYMMLPLLAKKETEKLSTSSKTVFAFRKIAGGDSIVVIVNLDNSAPQTAKVSIPGLKTDDFVLPFRLSEPPVAKNGSFQVSLKPYEIQVFAIKKTLNLNRF